MIPLGTHFIFYPIIGGGQVEAAGYIKATNQLGAFVSYSWVTKNGTRRTKDFFGWEELQKVQILSMGGLCE